MRNRKKAKKKKNTNMTRLPFQHGHIPTGTRKLKKKETFSCIKAEIVVVHKMTKPPFKSRGR